MSATRLRTACAFAALLVLVAAVPVVAQDSVAVAPDSVAVAPDSVAVAPDSVAVAPEDNPCAVTGYCEGVTRQVQRHFRVPPGEAGARGEVCFRIQRDGSVTDIETQRVRGGGALFRLAMMEAADAAGSRRAFGPLPEPFDPRWRWCVELSPR